MKGFGRGCGSGLVGRIEEGVVAVAEEHEEAEDTTHSFGADMFVVSDTAF